MVLKTALLTKIPLMKPQNPVQIAVAITGLRANKPRADGEDGRGNSPGLQTHIEILMPGAVWEPGASRALSVFQSES